ncbi:hypothetical protein A2335_03395 [Candidatus Peregrinibacteria bacterium RIFOXYB2_FULL_32_7]|nr:MAG: hypothetical protein A2335_03395 [Candidatus Peregrinibacteria bacterium RIFOXYB2_FULL_32_7]
MDQTWKIIVAVIITALIVGGGVFFLQQNSIKELREGIQDLQKTTNEEPTINENITTPKTTDNTSSETPETKENATSLPAGVEWLTYSDNDLTFTYPKTFLGTSLQEDFDQNLGREQWEVTKQDNTIYIRPNFESPVAEFGSTYEIKVFQDTWTAEEEWLIAAKLNQGPESMWGNEPKTVNNYYVGILRNLDFGLGQIADVYALVPGGIDGLGKSLKPTEKHFIIYTYPDLYSSYVEDILIPSIQAK